MVRIYCRCNGGHYFVGEYCPFDGWSSPESRAIADVTRRLAEAGVAPSMEVLKECLSPAALVRTVVIEFGSEDSAFEALAPEAYVIQGQARQLKDLDSNWL